MPRRLTFIRIIVGFVGLLAPIVGIAMAEDEVTTISDTASMTALTGSDLGPQVAFSELLAQSENLDLSLRYARQQIAAGDLKEAGATLEGVLLRNPALGEVRVIYGLVLYRLGLYERADYELRTALDADQLSVTARSEAQIYRERIRDHLRKTFADIQLTLGVEWDSNMNQAPSSGQILVLDQIIPSRTTENRDFAYITGLQLNAHHDLGTQSGHLLKGQLSYYRSNKVETDELDLDAFQLSIGPQLEFGRLTVTPTVRWGFYLLDGQDYLQTLGSGVDLTWRWTPALRSFISFGGDDEDFRAIDRERENQTTGALELTRITATRFREGRRLKLKAGTQWFVAPRHALRFTLQAEDKNAARGYEAYQRYGAELQHRGLYRGGLFSVVSASWNRSEYDAFDPAISFFSMRKRQENRYHLGISAGVPLSSIVDLRLNHPVADVNLVVQYAYDQANANLINYDYRAHKVGFLLTKKLSLW